MDNGSSDGSGAIAAALGAQVIEERAKGFGAACWAGLTAARSELVCFMDCDGSLDPRDLPALAEAVSSGRMDLALGARAAEPGAWPWHARLANRLLAAELRRRTGAPLTDLGPMRAARRVALLDLDIRDRRFGWPLEMVMRAADSGWVVGELPVPYLRRAGGRSKVTGSVRGTAKALRDMAAVLA